ncbi:MAG: DUF4091 domain-containing protein [Bryobacteraceae bacterium]|jgi:hypothetical protein
MTALRNLALLCCGAAGLSLAASAAGKIDPLDGRFLPDMATNQFRCPANVWVTGPLAKIKPGATPGGSSSAEISAARNEFESFQVHVHAAAMPIQLNVTVSDFVKARTGERIPADPNVSVFREAYLNVTTVSDANGTPGLTPDALIPPRDPWFHEPRNAFPVTVPPHETRSAWIDVFVPPGTPSGYYLATVTVNDGAQVLAKVPARLKVWDFELPSTATLKSAFALDYAALCYAAYGSLDGCGKYPGSKGYPEDGLALTHAATAAFFLDHRVTIAGLLPKPTKPEGMWREFDTVYGPLLSGRAKTTLPGARLTAIDYASGLDADDVKDWLKHFKKMGWLPRLSWYLCDEPPAGCTWSQLSSRASTFRGVAPGVPILVTTDIATAAHNGVLDFIDILVPVVNAIQPPDGASRRASYDEWLKRPGKELWWYQSCNQHESCQDGVPGPKTSTWPSYMVDASPVRNRIFQWMAWLYGIQGELYYGTDGWGKDPWNRLYSSGGNGDGALYYPGTAARIGGKTPIPVASIRLKLIRDGMEDYEYLFALAKAGEADLARQITRSFITNAYTFSNDPAALTAAREKLGARLHRLALAKQN